MSRGYYYNGESMVYVRGRFGSAIQTRLELGMCEGPVRIRFKNYHKDIHVDDYGPDVPAETLSMLSEAEITMTLVHFDYEVLAYCFKESQGYSEGVDYGSMVGAGWPIGAGQAFPDVGSQPSYVNSYVSLSIATANPSYRDRRPWRFPSSYLAQEPIDFPLGTERSAVKLRWRAIPYSPPSANGAVSSRNAVLFDHNDDFD